MNRVLEYTGKQNILEVWPDMWHVFQMFPMKKAAQAMQHIEQFLLELD